jgi:ABC-2 type transport system ATP-binding protein
VAPIITVERLRKAYGPTIAVEDVSFTVEPGEIFGILGPNGAGKTTTVECLQGLRRADGGRLDVLGLDPGRQAAQLRRRIGAQLQDSALPDRLKVWEALDFFSSVGSGRGDWRRVMAEWGLGDKANATFGSLSGGQQQRLLVALAVVNDPEVVFLDEMTTGLDPAARRVAWDLIRAIRERGTTVVLVTHFMDEAEHLCDRIAVVDDRRIVALDTPRALVVRHGGDVRLSFTSDLDDLAWLDDIEQVRTVERRGRTVTVRGTGPVVALVAAGLVARGEAPADIQLHRATLEDVFLKLTGGSA